MPDAYWQAVVERRTHSVSPPRWPGDPPRGRASFQIGHLDLPAEVTNERDAWREAAILLAGQGPEVRIASVHEVRFSG
jgi:hypothetical protein